MKGLAFLAVLGMSAGHAATAGCPQMGIEQAAARATQVRRGLAADKLGSLDVVVSPETQRRISELKDALACVGSLLVGEAPPEVDAGQLQRRLSRALPANLADSPGDEREFVRIAQALDVRVSRPAELPGFLMIDFSIRIQCSQDHLLLVYELREGAWREFLRWQAPPWKEISGAFGEQVASSRFRWISPPTNRLHRASR